MPAQAFHQKSLEIIEVIREGRAQRGRQHRTPAIETIRHLLQEQRHAPCFAVQERPQAESREDEAHDHDGHQHRHRDQLAIWLADADDLQAWRQDVDECVHEEPRQER